VRDASCEVVVIGGGITGLTAAWEIAKRGLTPLVLERSLRVGGLLLTERSGGFVIEAGPDSVLAQKPAALDLCRELGLADRLIETRPPGGAFVLRGRRLYPLPSPSVLGLPLTWRALASYDLLPWSARLRMAAEPLVPRRAALDDESVGSFFRRRFGGATVDLIAQPLLGGIHAGDVERLSMASLFPRLLEAEREHGSVLRGWRRLGGRSSSGSAFRALRGGMDELAAALAARLGDAVRTKASATRLDAIDGGWRVVVDKGETVTARAVIIAAPASEAARLLSNVDREAADLCAEVPYVSTVSIALAYPRTAIAHPLDGTGFVVARRHSPVRVTACTWVSSKWEARAPQDFVLLRAFAGGAHDPGVVDLSDDELSAIAQRDLGDVLGISGAPSLSRVYRWRDAGAQHTVGQRARVEKIERRLAAHPGIVVAGSGFRAVGIPDCVADARAAAAKAAAMVARDGNASRSSSSSA
jgi:oxygen-dependent protoporphyrinogen oxidase